jgi:tRNA (guanine37-N1)-methyltransferase
MRFDIISLFPKLIEGYFEDSIIKNAKDNGLISIFMHQLRDYALDKHKQVDDTHYGGGSGMLLKVDVLSLALESVVKISDIKPKIIYLSPKGEKLNNKLAKELSNEKRIILVSGRYEGVDERFINFVDLELSIGDYVLSGGELPAAVVVESVSRFIPGVIGSMDSVSTDSLENSLLKYPQYTRPREFRGLCVPEILLSGNHKDIEIWRKEKSLERTNRKK